MTIGEKIKQARKKAGYTQKELGKKLGISQVRVAQYENGIRNPKIETVKKIATALNVPTDELYGVTAINHFTENFVNQNPLIEKILSDYIKKEIKNYKQQIHTDDIFLPPESELDNFSSDIKAALFNEFFDHVTCSEDMKDIHIYPKIWISDPEADIDKNLKENYLKLNETGKKEALKRVAELTQIKEYIE